MPGGTMGRGAVLLERSQVCRGEPAARWLLLHGSDAAERRVRLLHCEGSGKLDRARSRLYRGQILQENMRLKALAEIYTMHSFAQLCNLIFLSKFCQKFCKILPNFCKISKISEIFHKFWQNSSKFLKKCDFRAVQRSALCRSRRELSNAYLLAKFGLDTAENVRFTSQPASRERAL